MSLNWSVNWRYRTRGWGKENFIVTILSNLLEVKIQRRKPRAQNQIKTQFIIVYHNRGYKTLYCFFHISFFLPRIKWMWIFKALKIIERSFFNSLTLNAISASISLLLFRFFTNMSLPICTFTITVSHTMLLQLWQLAIPFNIFQTTGKSFLRNNC